MLLRYCAPIKNVAVGDAVDDSHAIAFGEYSGGAIYLDASQTIATITWHKAYDKDGTFFLAKDGAGNSITTSVAAGQSVEIPNELFGAKAIKAVGDVAGTITVTLKS